MAQSKIFFDIETIPVIGEGLAKKMHEEFNERATKDGKPTKTFDEFVQGAAINGAFARVITIGYAVDDGPVEVLEIDPDEDPLDPVCLASQEAEYDLLERFADVIDGVGAYGVLVGWNINIFDLRMLWQRAVVVGSRLKMKVPRPDTPPWKMNNVLDLAALWNGNGWSNRVQQYDLALAAGLIPEEVVFGDEDGRIVPSGSGGDVYRWAKEGQWQRILNHQRIDIHVTRALYRFIVGKEPQHDVRRKFIREMGLDDAS